MSARDNYPRLIHLAGASEAAREQAAQALDEIDQLRADIAILTEIAGTALDLAFKDKR